MIKYGVISLMFLANNEVVSLIALMLMAAAFFYDIAKARLEEAEW